MQSLVDVNSATNHSISTGLFLWKLPVKLYIENKDSQGKTQEKEDISNSSQSLNPGITAKKSFKIFEEGNVKSLGGTRPFRCTKS